MSASTHKDFVQFEINKYPAIRRDKRKLIIAHYFGEINLRKSGRALTLEEKQFLRMDPSKRITTAMVDLVDPGFATLFDIDEALRLIVHNAKDKYRLHQKWQQLADNTNVSKVRYQSPGDGLTCKWCHSMSDKTLKKKFNLTKHLKEYCNCIWFRGELLPVFASRGIIQSSHVTNQQEAEYQNPSLVGHP
jgi:hypothetical protein